MVGKINERDIFHVHYFHAVESMQIQEIAT